MLSGKYSRADLQSASGKVDLTSRKTINVATGRLTEHTLAIAEEVKDKQAANFCDSFRPTPAAYRPEAVSAADKARAELEALFGRK